MTIVSSMFRSMNTDIALLSPHGGQPHEDAVQSVRRIFEEVEQCLSRFRPDSELSELNRAAGRPFRASPLLFDVLSLALRAAEETNGLFDPTVLAALEAAGYDRSFELVRADTMNRVPTTLALSGVPNYRSIRSDSASRMVQLDVGQRLDLGGIGKGYAVDQALAATTNLPACCINAGGDLAVRGSPDGLSAWAIALEDGGTASPPTVRLTDAALATSTTVKRRWVTASGTRHHLIDPRTQRPSNSPLRTVTAVASTCVQADVGAKTALLLGESGLSFLAQRGMHGFAVGRNSNVFTTSGWPSA